MTLEETRPDGHGRARGIVSSRASGSRVDARTFAPPPALADVVESLWETRWDLRGQEPHRFAILADPAVTVAIEAGASRVVGVSTRLFRRELAEAGVIRAARLRPGAAHALLPDLDLARLADASAPLADVCSAPGLEARVLAPADAAAGLDVLGAWLEERVARPLDPRVRAAIDAVALIASSAELTTAEAVAARTAWSTRELQRLFRAHVGMTPKAVIRRARLREASVRIERGDGPTLAALAAELGYSDHAHLTRDFRAATGRTPSEVAAEGRRAAGGA